MQWAILVLLAAGALLGQAKVPLVGCKSDGQTGPVDAPTGKDPVLPISARAAERLAYYTVGDQGVLAPRNWYCFGLYGSGGTHLYVGPRPIPDVPVEIGIVVSNRPGGTSGRFSVAEVISRVFPAHVDFVRRVESEGLLDTPPEFPSGPYPDDRLSYKNAETVEYETRPDAEGLGTYDSSLIKNPTPIRGVAMLLGDTPDLLLLSVRLPPGLADLTDTIIQQVERDAAATTR